MEKDTFIKIMTEFENLYNRKSRSTSELSKILGGNIDFMGGDLVELIIKILHDSFPPHILEDKSTFSDIEWFIYDCNFGKSEYSRIIVESNGKRVKYKVSTFADLYDSIKADYSNLKQVS